MESHKATTTTKAKSAEGVAAAGASTGIHTLWADLQHCLKLDAMLMNVSSGFSSTGTHNGQLTAQMLHLRSLMSFMYKSV